MTSPLSTSRVAFITPLSREQAFEPGAVFAASELTRRILTLCWRDCCCPPYFSRAPAPVVEYMGGGASGQERVPVRAWWLLDDGIIPESEGPQSERLRPYFGEDLGAGQMWPRYEFCVLTEPWEVEMSLFWDVRMGLGHRTRLSHQPDGRVRVAARDPWWTA